jgi:hypothetical protein
MIMDLLGKMSEFEEWIKNKEARRRARNDQNSKRRGITHLRSKKIKRSRAAGFSTETRERAYQRSKGYCENPMCKRRVQSIGGEHHCLPRSYYRKADRNDLWNCAKICNICHDRITSPTTRQDVRLRRYFERIAWSRRTYSESRHERESKILEENLKNDTLDLFRSFQSFTT